MLFPGQILDKLGGQFYIYKWDRVKATFILSELENLCRNQMKRKCQDILMISLELS